MENNPELQLAWQFIENTGTHLFLTGKAGTGKTTFLKRLREHTPKRMVVLAPTGIAAINAGGGTIHSFFQISMQAVSPSTPFSKYLSLLMCPKAHSAQMARQPTVFVTGKRKSTLYAA